MNDPQSSAGDFFGWVGKFCKLNTQFYGNRMLVIGELTGFSSSPILAISARLRKLDDCDVAGAAIALGWATFGIWGHGVQSGGGGRRGGDSLDFSECFSGWQTRFRGISDSYESTPTQTEMASSLTWTGMRLAGIVAWFSELFWG